MAYRSLAPLHRCLWFCRPCCAHNSCLRLTCIYTRSTSAHAEKEFLLKHPNVPMFLASSSVILTVSRRTLTLAMKRSFVGIGLTRRWPPASVIPLTILLLALPAGSMPFSLIRRRPLPGRVTASWIAQESRHLCRFATWSSLFDTCSAQKSQALSGGCLCPFR